MSFSHFTVVQLMLYKIRNVSDYSLELPFLLLCCHPTVNEETEVIY